MIRLANRVSSIDSSQSMALSQRVSELQAMGRGIIDFTMGEPDLDTPSHIVEAAIKALRKGETHYTPAAGILPLRELIAQKMSTTCQFPYTASQVAVGSGAKQIIYHAMAATLEPGDEVIVPAPYWLSYPAIVKLCGGVPVSVPCTQATGFKLTADLLESAVTPKTRWLILNSPNNPSGTVYDEKSLSSIAKVLAKHPHILVMTDDVYSTLVYKPQKHINFLSIAPDFAERTLLVNSFSKSHAMTGWRIAFAVGPLDLIRGICKLVSQTTTCASSIGQAAAIAALRGPANYIEKIQSLYEKRRSLMTELINAIPGFNCELPAGTFYLYPSIQNLIGCKTPANATIATDDDMAAYLLEEADVAVMSGSAYGLSPHLRLSYATSLDAITEGCRRMKEACARLNK